MLKKKIQLTINLVYEIFLDNGKQGKMDTVFTTGSELRYSVVCSSVAL